MNPTPTKDQIKQRAALILIESGLATVGEVATLRGVSRQYLQKAACELEPRKRRKQYLKEVWMRTINRLS
jgi:hypothetical protein